MTKHRSVERKQYKPLEEQMALWPDISGNTINGLGETDVRPPSPIYWHAPDATPHGHLQQWMGAHSAKSPAPEREQMIEERTAIQSRKPVAIAEAAVQKDPGEWPKKVHDKAAALGAELVGIARMDPCGFLRAARLISLGSSCSASSWITRY